MTRSIRPPTDRGGERVRKFWEEEVSRKLDGTDFTLDDALRALFLSTTSTQGQENEKAIKNLSKLVADNVSLRGKVTNLEKRIRLLEQQALFQKTPKTEALKQKIDNLEVLAWR
jgi:hypothetical protein